MVTVFPETVHTANVVEEKLTDRFELAEAVTAKGAAPEFTLLNEPKVIVWEP